MVSLVSLQVAKQFLMNKKKLIQNWRSMAMR
jgi:hypothetical protein